MRYTLWSRTPMTSSRSWMGHLLNCSLSWEIGTSESSRFKLTLRVCPSATLPRVTDHMFLTLFPLLGAKLSNILPSIRKSGSLAPTNLGFCSTSNPCSAYTRALSFSRLRPRSVSALSVGFQVAGLPRGLASGSGGREGTVLLGLPSPPNFPLSIASSADPGDGMSGGGVGDPLAPPGVSFPSCLRRRSAGRSFRLPAARYRRHRGIAGSVPGPLRHARVARSRMPGAILAQQPHSDRWFRR
jgi:hypothetical protein